MGSLHGVDIIGVNGRIVAKSYSLHLAFSCGLSYRNITVLYTLSFPVEGFVHVPQFTLRGLTQGKLTFFLVPTVVLSTVFCPQYCN